MPKLSQEEKELMQSLYAQGVSVKEISWKTGVPYADVYKYTVIIEKYGSLSNYSNHLAARRNKSPSDYQKETYIYNQERPSNKKLSALIKIRLLEIDKTQTWLSEQIGNTRAGTSLYALGKIFPNDSTLEKIYHSLGETDSNLDAIFESLEKRIKENGFNSPEEYIAHLKEQKKLESKKRNYKLQNKNREYFLKKRGFKSFNDYRRILETQHQQLPQNQRLANIIKTRLRKMGKSHLWLAEKLGLGPNSISAYTHARRFPREKNFKKICSLFNLPYKTIDDFLN
ncbi:helix-turn-helix transcriptional regulator [Candidatus Woesearchaeota archaeon]|nr:helix-turn-helix transcriptional regulator [Candidatus Woesearchaeota archaeon]